MRVKQALNQKMIKKLQQLMFVGVLVKEENLPQTVDGKQTERFYMKCLSPFPQKLLDQVADQNLIFPGNVNIKQNRKWLSPILANEEKGEEFLFLFSLRYSNSYLYVEIMKKVRTQQQDFYHIIPAPQLVMGQTRADFERKLIKGSLSFLLPKYSSEFGSPEFLYYEGRVYGNLSLKSVMNSITFFEQGKEVMYVDVPKQWKKWIDLELDDNLYFMGRANYQKLQRLFQEKGQQLASVFQQVNMNDKKPIIPTTKQGRNIEKEIKFLERVKALAADKKLYIEESDIYNFHACVKTNNITIVGGMSGTGKSQFVKLYGEALGLQPGKELLFIPVSPSYQEPEDILGYMHPTTGEYMESQTGLVSLVHEAEQHPEQLYMVVFDEMNLSQAEHWFSPFLSLLEMEEDNRYLSLYKKKEQTGGSLYKEKIKIGRNIIFVGTVNFDETTRPLSDRLLDRINMITFQKMTFRQAVTLYGNGTVSTPAKPSNITAEEFYTKWVNRNVGLEVLTEEEIELLDALHELLQSYDPGKGISYRVALAMARFIENIPQSGEGIPLLSREEAFDLQLKQRVLTKLRGLESTMAPLLTESKGKSKTLLQLLESPIAKEVSSFAHCIAFIHQKIRELELYGYAK